MFLISIKVLLNSEAFGMIAIPYGYVINYKVT